MAEVLTCSPLFVNSTEIGLLYSIFSKLGTPSEEQWEGLSAAANYSPEWPQWRGRALQEVGRGGVKGVQNGAS